MTDAVPVSDPENHRSAYGYSIDIDNGEEDKETHCDVQFGSADETVGQVAGSGHNVYGASSMLAVIPNDGYEFDYWSVNGEKDENPIKADSYTDKEGTTTVGAAYLAAARQPRRTKNAPSLPTNSARPGSRKTGKPLTCGFNFASGPTTHPAQFC